MTRREMSIKKVLYRFFTISLIVSVFVFSAGCIRSQSVVPLDAVEVSEYRGEKLDSVNDFRENSIRGPQYINVSEYRLKVGGLVENPLNLEYNQVMEKFQSYEKVVTLDCVEGWSVRILWQGVLVKDILADAKVNPEANTIIFHAVDGYSTSFPLGYVTENDIIIAHMMNNITIPPERGFPFQLVAESKWGYKWIKWITEIELSDDVNYKGFWESRGYSNNGNLDESKFDF